MERPWKRHARRMLNWVRLVFTPLSLLVIAFFVWDARQAVAGLVSDGVWPLLLLAVFLWAGATLLAPLVTICIFRICGSAMSYGAALRIHCGRLPAKYLPGGIWHSVGRGGDYYALGHAPAKVGLYFLVENVLLVATTIGLGAALSYGLIPVEGLRAQVSYLAVGAIAILVAFPFGLRLAGKTDGPFPLVAYVSALLALALYWALLGLTFAVYVAAFPGFENARSLTETAGIFVFSWSIGYLALFAPQGIGVSDVIAGYLLSGGNLEGKILTLMLGFRLVGLVADITCWLLTRLYERNGK